VTLNPVVFEHVEFAFALSLLSSFRKHDQPEPE
jgi:hypothetical protein